MDRLLSVVFVAFLALPGLLLVTRGTDVEGILKERRRPTPFPSVGVSSVLAGSFSAGIEDWFSDAQGARIGLLHLRSLLWWYGMRRSPSDEMLRGDEQWVFTTQRSSLPVFRGLDPLRDDQLETLRAYIEGRSRWLEQRGIQLLVLIAPSKQSVYPERIPGRFTRHGPTQLDQLLDRMRGSPVPLHDFRPDLTAEKAADRPEAGDYTYHPLGSHWTDRGARAAARSAIDLIRAALAPRFPDWHALADADFSVVRDQRPGDTTAGRLHLGSELTQSVWEYLVQPPRARMTEKLLRERHLQVPDPSLPDAVVIHDSFGLALWPILSQSFQHSIFLGEAGPREETDATVAAAAPDVVVIVIVERNLVDLPDFWPLLPQD